MPDSRTLTSAQTTDPLPIVHLGSGGRFDCALTPPGSKSITNRALVLAGLASGTSTLRHALVEADDTARMIAALGLLGARVDREGADILHVSGVGGRWNPTSREVHLDLGNAGTATRFLAAAAALSRVPVIIDGNPRMRQRPIGELTGALASLGATIQHLGTPDCPPVRIVPPAFDLHAPKIEFGHLKSSQFVSALLLVAPWIAGGLTIRHISTVTSPSYIWMSLRLLERLGASVQNSDDLRVIRVGPPESPPETAESPDGHAAGLAPFDLSIEPDASGATYWFAAAALCPGSRAVVRGLGPDSLQGDAGFPDLMERMGARIDFVPAADARSGGEISCVGPAALKPIVADMTDMPDAAMSLAAAACFAPGSTIIRGLTTLRVKESDRIGAMEHELAKVGVKVETNYLGDAGAIRLTPPMAGIDCSPGVPRVEFDTYDDHRMAMSLALIGLRRPNIWIRNPSCVNKTYPTFWRDLARLNATVR